MEQLVSSGGALQYIPQIAADAPTIPPDSGGGTVYRPRVLLSDNAVVSAGVISSGVSVTSGNRLTVLSGGFASDTFIGSGGAMHVSEGGAAGDTTIAEIASHVGISDPQDFSRIFKQHTGLSPSEWIKQNIAKK